MATERELAFKPVKSPVWRYTLFTVGSTSFLLGVIGVFLPVLPTTPFMILAAACYARSSERFYHWLIYNRVFGEPIRQWMVSRTIPMRARRAAIAMVILSFGITVGFVVSTLIWQLLLVLLAAALLFFILRIPVRDDGEVVNVDNADNNKTRADQ